MKKKRPDRYVLHQALDRHIDFAERKFDEETNLALRAGWAKLLINDLLDIVAQVAGPDLLATAYGENPESDDAAGVLAALAQRTSLAARIFASLESPNDLHPSSLLAASEELAALASGDAPAIFAQHQRNRAQRTNAYRLAQRQLAAFEWEAFLAEMGEATAVRRARITMAFGAQWDTVRKWRSPISRLLGSRHLEDVERHARLTAQQGWQLRGRTCSDSEALVSDGRAYQDELRRQSSSLEK